MNLNRNRFRRLSVVCMAVSLLLSPQDLNSLTVYSAETGEQETTVTTGTVPEYTETETTETTLPEIPAANPVNASGTVTQNESGLYQAIISSDDIALSVSFTEAANIPAGAVVSMKEFVPASIQYDALYAVSGSTVRLNRIAEDGTEAELRYARFFDISFICDGEVIEPESAVSVEIAYNPPVLLFDITADVIHITEEQAVLMNAEAVQDEDDRTVQAENADLMRFETDSFSAYGLVFYSYGDNIGDALDGMTYALVNWQYNDNYTAITEGSKNGPSALIAREFTSSGPKYRLEGQKVSVYPEDKTSFDSDLFSHYMITETSATEWTFTWIQDNDYYITAEVDGVTKYLTIISNADSGESPSSSYGALKLLETPNEYSVITVQNNGGSGDQVRNKLRLVNKDNFAVNLKSRSYQNGYQAYGPRATSTEWSEWFVPAILVNENQSDPINTGNIHTAIKVSVSDRVNLEDGDDVVIYSKVWNPDLEEYENYAINGNGNLVKIWESGSVVQWEDADSTSLYWTLIQYGDSGYYEFYNPVTEKYLAPQNGQLLSNSTIGVTLNGREQGDYTSTIEAWDGRVWSWYGYQYAADPDSGELSLIPAPETQSAQMCFAVRKPSEIFHPVDTVDSKAAGITIKMYDYDGALYGNDRNLLQRQVIGESTYVGDGNGARTGLVENTLTDGFPVATITGRSLEPLFSSNDIYPEREANHLFIKSTYDETGYYEYSCFDNSAFLMHEDGTGDSGSAEGYANVHDFTVYQELVTPGVGTGKPTSFRGNFLPFDEPDAGDEHNTYENRYDKDMVALSPDNPRYHEKLYNQTQSGTNYFFGMSIESDFMIPESGCDENGNPLIFEFTGDDDFWLFIDDVLVIDLGGIHNALTGKINFSTGVVETYNGSNDGRYTTRMLVEFFRAAGVFPDGTPWDEALVSNYFKNDGSFASNEGIFKDYSSHNMKIFYMERGRGSSNLRLRFNLATVPENSVFLQKNLTGTQTTDYSNTKYAYQLYYKTEDSDEFVRYVNPSDEAAQPHLENQNRKVEYAASVELNGQVYEDVFFLRAGEVADFTLPDKKTQYYFKELSVLNQEYDYVKINGVESYTSDFAQTLVKSYTDVESTVDTVSARKRVIYENHIDSDYLKKLAVTKQVIDKDGNPVENDQTGFEFQINFLDENGTPVPYRKGEYYVRDSEGNYYVYVEGKLSKHGREKIVCSISGNNGSIAGIPDGFTVEIENLLPTTRFMIEEQDFKIPLGYQLMRYEPDPGTYNLIDADTPNYGIIRENTNAHLTVVNQKGFGITALKQWTDAEYTQSHETVYIALFHKEPDNSLSFVEGSLRELVSPNTTVYYFNDEDEASEYAAQEVNPETVQPAGWRSDLSSATDCQPYPEHSVVSLEAQTPDGNTYNYDYIVSYEHGEIGGSGHNIRTDTITNSRDSLRILKQTVSGDPLYGAVFSLKDLTLDEVIGTFTSDAEGFVTNAFLTAGHTYELEETDAPRGYQLLNGPVTITVGADGMMTLTFDEADAAMAEVQYENSEQKSGTLTLKNKTDGLTMRKVDTEGKPLRGAVFNLYQFDRANNRKYLIANIGDLISDHNGVFFGGAIRSGYYLLEETSPPNGFAKPDYDIVFHVRLTDGAIDRLYMVRYDTENGVYETLGDLPADWIDSDENSLTLNIPNERITGSMIIRKTVDSIDFSNGVPAFMFRLIQTKDENGDAILNGPEYIRCISFDETDTDSFKEVRIDNLPIGTYIVEELSEMHYLPAGLTVSGDDHAIISSYQTATVALVSTDAVTVSYRNRLVYDEPPGYTAYADNKVQYSSPPDSGE